VFANKQDLPGALSHDDIARVRIRLSVFDHHCYVGRSLLTANALLSYLPQILELQNIKNRHWKIQACSAVVGTGLLDGVSWVVEDIAARIFMLE